VGHDLPPPRGGAPSEASRGGVVQPLSSNGGHSGARRSPINRASALASVSHGVQEETSISCDALMGSKREEI